MIDKLRGYRTVILAFLVSILPAIEAVAMLLDLPQWRGIIDADVWPFYALGVAALKVAMRWVTTTPMGKA